MDTFNDITNILNLGIQNFQKKLTFNNPNADNIVVEYLRKNPKLTLYISSFSSEIRKTIYSKEVTFYFEYQNTDISFDRIFICDNEYEIYKVLSNTIENSHEKVVIITNNNTLEFERIIIDLNQQFSGFFYKIKNYNYQSYYFEYFNLKYILLDYSYRMSVDRLRLQEYEIDNAVEVLSKKLFCKEMSDVTKVYIAHNYLAKTINYKDIGDDISASRKIFVQSAYGALINHECVCQGYADAFKRLMDSQNIKCIVITGKIRNDDVYHAWNVVSFDNINYYHIDVTWDSLGDGMMSFNYFCLSDEDLNPTRLWTKPTYVRCNSKLNILNIVKQDLFKNRNLYKSKGIDIKYL